MSERARRFRLRQQQQRARMDQAVADLCSAVANTCMSYEKVNQLTDFVESAEGRALKHAHEDAVESTGAVIVNEMAIDIIHDEISKLDERNPENKAKANVLRRKVQAMRTLLELKDRENLMT